MAIEADVLILQRLPSRVQSLNRNKTLAACTTSAAEFAQLPTGTFGSLEVNTLFVSGSIIEPVARAFTNFLIGALRLRPHEAFLPVMDTIALPEWPPNLIIKRTGCGARGAQMSHQFQCRRQ